MTETEKKTTTWGDCGNNQCREYGRMIYGIDPGDECQRCWEMLRWWDRWHDGKHHGESGLTQCQGWL
jgi:hypothetical protein